MKLNLFNQGKFDTYSFRDLEYGVKLARVEVEGLDYVMKVLKRMFLEKLRKKRLTKYQEDLLENELDPFKKEKEKILKRIRRAEEELSERLLTGNDDGTLERELLGAKYV